MGAALSAPPIVAPVLPWAHLRRRVVPLFPRRIAEAVSHAFLVLTCVQAGACRLLGGPRSDVHHSLTD